MIPMPLGLFVEKLQPKVGLGRYDILFAYFVVEAKHKTTGKPIKWIICFSPVYLNYFWQLNDKLKQTKLYQKLKNFINLEKSDLGS